MAATPQVAAQQVAAAAARQQRLVGYWMLGCAGMVVGAVVLGEAVGPGWEGVGRGGEGEGGVGWVWGGLAEAQCLRGPDESPFSGTLGTVDQQDEKPEAAATIIRPVCSLFSSCRCSSSPFSFWGGRDG